MKSLRTLAAVSLAVVMAGGLAVATMESASAATASITVTPSTSLKNNQKVTVTGKGFGAGKTVYVLECTAKTQDTCDVGHLTTVTATPKGTFTTKFTVRTGAVGSKTIKKGGSVMIVASDQAAAATKKITFKK